MILKGLKRNAIKKSIEAHLKKRGSSSTGVSKLRTLAVLVDASYSINRSAIVKLSKELGVTSENLIVVGYKEDKDIESDSDAIYYNDKSFAVSGAIKNKDLENFIHKDYDVLVNFYEEDKLELNYIASVSKAKLKIGFAEVDNRINDLIIGSTTNDTSLFLAELKKYLKILEVI